MPINRLALLALIATISAHASPPIELVPDSQIPHVAKEWLKAAQPPKPIRLMGAELPAPYAKGDCMFWVEYAGQPLAKGDLFLFVYGGGLTVRQIDAVYSDHVTTDESTPIDIKLTDVRGVVRRVIRVVEDVVVPPTDGTAKLKVTVDGGN